MEVLVVDDDPDLRGVVRRALEREGVQVREAADGESALAAQAGRPAHVVVLDLQLPDVHGLEVLARLRSREPDLRVLLLTAARRESDRVLGLVSGADDYVVKPFSPRELAARVLALGRRIGHAPPSVIEMGRITIDVTARTVHVDGRVVELPRREYDLLLHLASNPDRTFSKEDLLHDVWSSSSEWLGVATVIEHVRRLRLRIERDPSNPELIVTARGGGYRFAAEAAGRPGREVAQLLGAAVVIVGTTIVEATDEAAALLGSRDQTDLVGHELFDFVPPASEQATRARHEGAAAGRWPAPERITLRRVDGTEVDVLISSGPILSAEGVPASRVQLWPVD